MWDRWYGSIVERFRKWAESDPGVRGAIIVGSQARIDMPADEWSDLDVVIFHTEPSRLIDSNEWFQPFGTVVLSMIEPTAVGGSRERRVLYSDGRDVDFAVFPSAAIPFIASAPEGLSVLGRGFKILVDKDHQLDRIPSVARVGAPESSGLPTKEEFLANVSDFYYHLLWFAKKLRRGETWLAKMGCDGYLKLLLVRMIEWSTVASSPSKVDVWHDGRFLDRWAPPEVKSRLPATFAQYETHDLSRALGETGQLYSLLAHGVAGKFGWAYPTEAEDAVWKLVHRTLADQPTSP
jgi:aminoglycoside 6-adenylyltransferase